MSSVPFAIEARGLSKSFKGVAAVDGVDVLVRPGELVGLLGPNGAGKTTTLMMLLGITSPDAGSIRLLGRPLPAERSPAMAEINFTASYLGLPGDLRVRQFLRVFGDLYGVSSSRVDEVVELLGVGPLLRQRGTELSSGQRTLVGLAKALLNRPRLLILDEPTASLDPDVAERVRGILLQAQGVEGFALLVTSHNMADIERMCGRVMFMARGRVVADGTPSEVAAQYGRDDLESTFLSIAEASR
ncbi:MAG: ABC transporter ATP-binding protein [Actinobacteria bacterium]|nr:ABC transporter ATP-binding protein [Actinomycetota bacterium]